MGTMLVPSQSLDLRGALAALNASSYVSLYPPPWARGGGGQAGDLGVLLEALRAELRNVTLQLDRERGERLSRETREREERGRMDEVRGDISQLRRDFLNITGEHQLEVVDLLRQQLEVVKQMQKRSGGPAKESSGAVKALVGQGLWDLFSSSSAQNKKKKGETPPTEANEQADKDHTETMKRAGTEQAATELKDEKELSANVNSSSSEVAKGEKQPRRRAQLENKTAAELQTENAKLANAILAEVLVTPEPPAQVEQLQRASGAGEPDIAPTSLPNDADRE